MKIDEKILVGARNAVETCLNVSNNDKVLIFTDKETKEIGLALRKAVFEVGAKSELLLLEEIGQRPLEQVPDSLWSYIADYKPTVSFFAAQNKKGEINFRIPLIETLRKDYRIRHGHMVGISTKLMKTGMQADYKEVDARTRAVFELVKNAREIVVKAPNGTDFLARFDPEKINWVVWGGLYHEPGLWGNLPEGEVFTSPINVNGVLKASVIGEYFSEKYGLLNPPINLMVQNGFLIESSQKFKTWLAIRSFKITYLLLICGYLTVDLSVEYFLYISCSTTSLIDNAERYRSMKEIYRGEKPNLILSGSRKSGIKSCSFISA